MISWYTLTDSNEDTLLKFPSTDDDNKNWHKIVYNLGSLGENNGE